VLTQRKGSLIQAERLISVRPAIMYIGLRLSGVSGLRMAASQLTTLQHFSLDKLNTSDWQRQHLVHRPQQESRELLLHAFIVSFILPPGLRFSDF
jgi:hypothetical protein